MDTGFIKNKEVNFLREEWKQEQNREIQRKGSLR